MDDEGFREFIAARRWRFAKTMADTPHEYTVSGWNPDRAKFEEAVQFIRDNGYGQKFFSKIYLYYDVDGHQYWTMGAPMPVTILINRAAKR
jgi:hypothetical protein